MQKSTITITLNDDQVAELVTYLISKGIKGFTITDTNAPVEKAQAAQTKTETTTENKPAEKPANTSNLSDNEKKKLARKPGTSYKAGNNTSVAFLIEDGEVVEKAFNPATHRIFNCLAQSHLMDDNGKKVACRLHIVGRSDYATEMRYLEASLMFKECVDADMVPRFSKEDIDRMKAELNAKIEKAAEREAKREEAMNKASKPADTDELDDMTMEYPTK